jgi:hypothetical protein
MSAKFLMTSSGVAVQQQHPLGTQVHLVKNPVQGHSMQGTRTARSSAMTSLEARSREMAAGLATTIAAKIVTISVKNCMPTVEMFVDRVESMIEVDDCSIDISDETARAADSLTK